MSASVASTGYLYLVTVGDETTTMNRPQLLGSMPKLLEGLGPGDVVAIRLIDQARFAALVKQMLSDVG